MTIFIVSVCMALGVSFLCSLAEACLLSLSLSDIAALSERAPLAGRIWKRFRENIHRPISVILIVNTLAHTIGAAVSGAKFDQLFDRRWIGLYSIAFSLVMIQWTEILPKTLGVRYNKAIAAIGAVPLSILEKLFAPLVFITEFINRPFEGRRTKQSGDALAEIAVLARFAAYNRLISGEQEKIVSRSLDLSKTLIESIMVERDDVKYVSSTMSLADALVEAHLHRHTRYPLAEAGDIDRILGYVNFKDIVTALRLNPRDPSLKGIMRPIISVSPRDNVAAVMKLLINGHNHIAIVKDTTTGRTAGLVSLEDIIETIVGDIKDEYDVLPSYIHEFEPGRITAGGAVRLAILRQRSCGAVPDSPMTLDEWLREHLKRTPKFGDTMPAGACRIIVNKVRRGRVMEAVVDTGSTNAPA